MSLDRPIQGSWLATRREADNQARAAAESLLTLLAEHLAQDGAGPASAGPLGTEVTLVDLGAGTGANPAWLVPRLQRALTRAERQPGNRTWRQHWVLLDHDPALLRSPDLPGALVHAVGWERVEGDVGDLPRVLSGRPRPVVITCSALLDLLEPGDIDRLAGTVVSQADAALLSLSVTGGVRFDPPLPGDVVLQTAFDRHQRRPSPGTRTRLAGPAGADLMTTALSRRGWRVNRVVTPWHLGPGQAALLRRWSAERVDAALEVLAPEDPDRDRLGAWWQTRSGQIAADGLRVQVDHLDLLAVPGPPTGTEPGDP